MNNAFDNVIGQSNVKARLMASAIAPEGKSLIQPFLAGAAGLGKTQMAKAFVAEMAEKSATWKFYGLTRLKSFAIVTARSFRLC